MKIVYITEGSDEENIKKLELWVLIFEIILGCTILLLLLTKTLSKSWAIIDSLQFFSFLLFLNFQKPPNLQAFLKGCGISVLSLLPNGVEMYLENSGVGLV